jgi:hypothetical protein
VTKSQAAAFVMGQAALLHCRIAGMVAENAQREHLGESMAYTEEAFAEVEREFTGTLGWYAAIKLFSEATDDR